MFIDFYILKILIFVVSLCKIFTIKSIGNKNTNYLNYVFFSLQRSSIYVCAFCHTTTFFTNFADIWAFWKINFGHFYFSFMINLIEHLIAQFLVNLSTNFFMIKMCFIDKITGWSKVFCSFKLIVSDPKV